MALNQMQVFNQYVKSATIETLAQMVEKFNAASGGTIMLTTQGFDGDYLQEAFYASLHAAQRRVDRYATNEAVAATNLTQVRNSGVKVAGGFGPILYEPGQLTWMQKNPAEAIAAASQNLAEAIMQDQLNTAIAAAVAAIENQGTATYDASALSPSSAVTYGVINSAHAKFGDHSSTIRANVMTGAQAHVLVGQNLSNSERLFVSDGVQVIDILGKLVVITDAPALTDTGIQKVLGLVEAGVIVYDGSDLITNMEESNGKERIETTFQADYTFGLSLKGYTWDTTTGGPSPTDAELATGGNWDKTATSIKHTAGVIAVGDA